MEGIGNDTVNALVLSLGKHFKTGDLSTGISYRVVGDTIEFWAPDHWRYVEYGTPGRLEGKQSTVGGETVSFPAKPDRKMPVYRSGDRFLNFLTNDENFALAKFIQLHGTQPYPFVRPVIYLQLRDIIRENIKRHGVTA